MRTRDIYPWLILILIVISVLAFRFSNFRQQFLFGAISGLALFGTQVFYTLRKEKFVNFGKVKNWLQAHIVIGLIGLLFLVFHTDLSFSGFAGLLLALTLVVFVSGLFGQYIYAQIPAVVKGQRRSLDKLEVQKEEITIELRKLFKDSKKISQLLISKSYVDEKIDLYHLFKSSATNGLKKIYFSYLAHKQYRRKNSGATIIFSKKLKLEQQIRFYYLTNRILRKWHIFHIPLTATLFFGIFTHVFSMLYFGRML